MSPTITPGDGGIFWAGLPQDPALRAEQLALGEGAVVHESSAPAGKIFFIEQGLVRTYDTSATAKTRLLEILGPGDWFGESALAGLKSFCSQAVAGAPTILWAVQCDVLFTALKTRPLLAIDFIRQLALRLQSAREEANRFASEDAAARLVNALLRFSRTSLAVLQKDGTVTLRITHKQLAQAVGAARETISLALTQLRQHNLVKTGRNRLIFKPADLSSFLDSEARKGPA